MSDSYATASMLYTSALSVWLYPTMEVVQVVGAGCPCSARVSLRSWKEGASSDEVWLTDVTVARP